MALGNSDIQVVRTYIGNLQSSKTDMEKSLVTVKYVKSNNDLINWFDNTEVGNKWSQNVDKLIKATDMLNKEALAKLIQRTNSLLDQQEQINKQG